MNPFERIGSTGLGGEPAPVSRPAERSLEASSPSLRIQILAAEHWSLLASRSLAWNESFSRTGMYLTTLTGAIVALALAAQTSAFGEGFVVFALVILPIVFFLGITTFIRLGESSYHDALCVVGMNRIRAAYLELAPDLARHFVTSPYDDAEGISRSSGVPPGPAMLHFAAATPVVVSTINAVVAAVIAALAALRFGAASPTTLAIGALFFVLVVIGQLWYTSWSIRRVLALYRPLFPRPDSSV